MNSPREYISNFYGTHFSNRHEIIVKEMNDVHSSATHLFDACVASAAASAIISSFITLPYLFSTLPIYSVIVTTFMPKKIKLNCVFFCLLTVSCLCRDIKKLTLYSLSIYLCEYNFLFFMK